MDEAQLYGMKYITLSFYNCLKLYSLNVVLSITGLMDSADACPTGEGNYEITHMAYMHHLECISSASACKDRTQPQIKFMFVMLKLKLFKTEHTSEEFASRQSAARQFSMEICAGLQLWHSLGTSVIIDQ